MAVANAALGGGWSVRDFLSAELKPKPVSLHAAPCCMELLFGHGAECAGVVNAVNAVNAVSV